MPRCLIIAGPNGAGKTTFALEYLPAIGVRHFLNADMIAAGMAPLAPESVAAAAGRLFLQELEGRITAGEDFAFETTLAGRGYLKFIERLKAKGWTVELYYLALPSVAISKSRVAERVTHGGHNIPEADINRRYPRSLHNLFNDYSMRVDKCVCYLNGSARTIIFDVVDANRVVRNREMFDHLLKEAGRWTQ